MDKPFLNLTPNASMQEFWLPLYAFDFSENGKNGCGRVNKNGFHQSSNDVYIKIAICFHVVSTLVSLIYPAVFPSNQQLSMHLGEFLTFGYKPSIGNVECKFPFRDSTRSISDFSVGVVDGHCKIILMFLITAMATELEFSLEQLKEISPVLASFSQIRCSYEHFDNPAHFFLYSLRIFAAIYLVILFYIFFK